jgi:peptidyl-prolyl cis-trans isomerase D
MVKPLFEWQYEKRVVDVVAIVPSDIKSINTPKDADIEKFYNSNQDHFRVPEFRDVSVLVLKLSDIEKTVTLTDKEKADGFEAHQAGLGGAPLKEARDTLLKELKQEMVNKTFQDLSAAIDDALAGGASVDEVARKHKLALLKLSQMQRTGAYQGADPRNPLDQNILRTIVTESFQMDATADARLTEVDANTFVAIHVDRISPAYVPPLKDIKSEVVRVWQDQERMKAAVRLGSTLIEKVNKGERLGDVIKSHGLKLIPDLTVSQVNPKAVPAPLTPQAVQRIFEAKLKTAIIAPGSKGHVIVFLKKTIPVNRNTQTKEYLDFTQRITELLREDIASQFIRTLEARYPVEIHRRVLEGYVQQTSATEER